MLYSERCTNFVNILKLISFISEDFYMQPFKDIREKEKSTIWWLSWLFFKGYIIIKLDKGGMIYQNSEPSYYFLFALKLHSFHICETYSLTLLELS